jgi:deaminated glutathione amidase
MRFTRSSAASWLAVLLLWLLSQSALAEGLTISAISVTPERWDKQANLASIAKYAREAAGQGAQLVITPEGFLEGYVANVSQNKGLTEKAYREVVEPIDGPALTRLRKLAEELDIYLAVGFAELREGRAYNSLVVLSPDGETTLHYSKSHTLDDEPYNTHGDAFPVAETPLGRWGALICYDRQLPETARILSIKGAQLLIVPAWGSYNDMNTAMMRTRALENSVYVAFVHPNRVMIIDPKGRIVAQDAGEHDQLVVTTIRLDERIGSGPIRHRRPDIYESILEPARPR